jgi:hypothetical protein
MRTYVTTNSGVGEKVVEEAKGAKGKANIATANPDKTLETPHSSTAIFDGT